MTFLGPFNHKKEQSQEFWLAYFILYKDSEAVEVFPGHNGPLTL